MKLSQIMVTQLLVALLTVIYAAVPAAANVTPPANNCCTMYHRCIKSSLCTTLDCVCSSDVVDSFVVDDKPPPAYNCCTTMNNQCIKSNLCSVYNCVCGADVEEVLKVDDKPPANNCCTMNNQCVKSELCKELDCVCSSAVDEGKMKAKDGKAAFMSPRNIESHNAEENGMVKKGMRATQH